jgi:hypothetical protein
MDFKLLHDGWAQRVLKHDGCSSRAQAEISQP